MNAWVQSILAVTCVLASFGCATIAPPPELVEARTLYAKANEGLAAKYNPTDLYEAKKMLDQANQELEDHGDTFKVKDFAYLVTRKVQIAESKARTELERQKIAEAVKAGVVMRESLVQSTQAELAATRAQLEEERRQKLNANQELQKTSQQLELEKQARLTVEGKLAAAMKDLQDVAAVKEEERGLVITLSGSVLFASGKYALLQTAKMRLDQVAEALKAQGEDKRIVVEGHTDNRGSRAQNQELSFLRARAVREYLVSRGVEDNKITALGMGARHPVTGNATAEDRANNRRVEIVVNSENAG